jgi:hypothetical protein
MPREGKCSAANAELDARHGLCDTLKGKAEATFGGETRTLDVEGKREKKGK